MAVFKRVNDQYTVSFPAYKTGGGTLNVGDVISYNPNTKEVAELTSESAVVTAAGNGYEIFIIAQGDAVTEKTGTDYKDYNIGDTVDFTGHTANTSTKIITGYLVKDTTNIQF